MSRFSSVLCSRVLVNSSVSLSVMFALGLRRLLCIRSAQEQSAICYIQQYYDDKNRRRDDDDDWGDCELVISSFFFRTP